VRLFLPFLAIVGLGATPSFANDTCKPLQDAISKSFTVPLHAYATQTGGGSAQSTESIYVNGAAYIMTRGQWRHSPVTIKQIQEQQEDNLKNQKALACRFLRNESVGGEAAAVYSTHQEDDNLKFDGQFWISIARGLPLREEMDTDTGGGKSGKTHQSVRWEYNNVSAPPGVR